MFFREDDVEPAIALAQELFGPVGAFRYGTDVSYNACIATREFGKLWYGDLNMSDSELATKCKILGSRLGQTVYRFNLFNNFRMEVDTLVFKSS